MATRSTPADPAGEMRRWLELPLAYGPSVSHDSEAVYFLSDESGVPQPYVVPARGGAARQLLHGTERIGSVQANPAAPGAILAIDAGGNEHWQLALLDVGRGSGGAAVRALTSQPNVIHSPGRWSEDGRSYLFTSNARDARYFDVYELDLHPLATPRPRLTGDALHEVVAAQRGRVLVARANTNLDADLLLLDGERVDHLNPHDGELSVFGADFGPDGVYAAANPDRELAALVRYRPGHPAAEFVHEFGGDVEAVRRRPGHDDLALVVNRDGWSEVHLFNPATGEDRVFNSGPRGVVAAVRWYPDGSAFAYDVSSVDGACVFRRDVTTGKEKRLAGITSTPAATPAPALRSFLASDRVKIPYWEFAPRGPVRGTIIWVHGGPEAQARPLFAPATQCLIARGWRVIMPNVRGSAGYGRRFLHLDDVRLRMDSVRDVRELVADLQRQGKAAPGRVGIVGGSYGGFMVLASLTTYPELWGAGVDIVGISNLVTFLENTGPWRRRLRETEYGSLEQDRAFLESISPIHHVDRITAPLLVIHGRNDPRVPVSEAEQITATLRAAGRPVDLLVFDNEGHGLVRRENRLVAWERVLRWFEERIPN